MSEIDNLMNLSDTMSNETFKPINEFIETVMGLEEANLTSDMVEMLTGMITGAFTPALKEQSIQSVIEGYEDNGFTRAQAFASNQQMKDSFGELIDSLKPSEKKLELLNTVFRQLYEIFDTAYDMYHNYSVELPIQLDEGAQMPKYAHDDDAAADVYAIADQVIPAHSFSNVVHTGVRFGTPEGWKLKLSPRSSIGAKTPMRLSNMIGLIDGPYRGELMILYDNLSDSDYVIHKGDRIAQVELEKVYRFKGVQVDKVDTTDRGEGGLGSTGK